MGLGGRGATQVLRWQAHSESTSLRAHVGGRGVGSPIVCFASPVAQRAPDMVESCRVLSACDRLWVAFVYLVSRLPVVTGANAPESIPMPDCGVAFASTSAASTIFGVQSFEPDAASTSALALLLSAQRVAQACRILEATPDGQRCAPAPMRASLCLGSPLRVAIGTARTHTPRGPPSPGVFELIATMLVGRRVAKR